ncbi:MAG: hypothetical protein E7598_07065 [Ruminococcaceae bacterium]|nr:hypothetical protein [Oscillospiraceae bacterium]
MKKVLALILATFCITMAIPAFATADLSGIVFAEESQTPAIATSGYPRFEKLNDGTLILVNSGTIRFSNDNGATWTRKSINANAAKSVVTASGTAHALSLENWQGFVRNDGTVMVAYRSRTSGYDKNSGAEFYTSIRVMTSTDGGNTFGEEKIVVEGVNNKFRGFWEPYMVQLDDNTVAMYFADDYSTPSFQNISYVLYDIANDKWDDTIHTAINGPSRDSRDGMPVVTKLIDGGYAMVIEAFDYNSAYSEYNSVFVIGLSLSADGKVWSEPIPVAAPTSLFAGYRCAAPFITTLPDGRVIISYMTDEYYAGAYNTESDAKNCVYGAIISDAALTLDTELVATGGGAADGFTRLPDLFEDPDTGYMIWNTVQRVGRYVYFAGSSGKNNTSGSTSLRIRRADISALLPDTDLNGDGATDLIDALTCARNLVNGDVFKCDINGDERVSPLDILIIVKEALK